MAKAKVGLSGQQMIESTPKNTRQGSGKNTKYATSRNKARKPYRDRVSEVREWIKNISEKRGELGGHAICPYAFSVCMYRGDRSERGDSERGADVIVYIVGDCSVAAMMATVDHLNMTYRDYIWLDDHKDEPTFINGVQSNFGKDNLILCQRRDKLLQARENLHKTDYYTYWHQEMYKRIINGKFTSRQEQTVRRIWNDTHNRSSV